MKLKSDNFEHEGTIPSEFTCDGEDISPHLKWEEVPEDTKSFALIMDDPDAPLGAWVHWLVCNIPKEAREIPKNSVPEKAVQVKNSFRKKEYGGPCPPFGTHRYFFKLYALDVEKLKATNKRKLYKEIEKHKIAEAVLMGRYKRK